MGWPLGLKTGGGSFMYHLEDNLVSIGLVVHLNYDNPHLYPYMEFQRFKHHPLIEPVLRGGRRVAYGARAITEGGLQSVPKLTFPGGALIGCSAGFVNVPRIKGSHNAMKTGMLAAEAAVSALAKGRSGDELSDYATAYANSWVYEDLKKVRNVKPMWSKLGLVGGLALGGLDMWLNQLFGFGFGPGSTASLTMRASSPPLNRSPSAIPSPTASSPSTASPTWPFPAPTTRRTRRSTCSSRTRKSPSARTCPSTTSPPSATARPRL